MSISIQITGDASVANQELGKASSGLSKFAQDATRSVQQMAQQTGQASTAAAASVTQMSSAYRSSVQPIELAIRANTAYAQSLESIRQAAARAATVKSPSILGGSALGGAGADSLASINAAIKGGAALSQSLASITEGARVFSQTATKGFQQATSGLEALSGATVALFAVFQSSRIFGGFLEDVALTTARTDTLGIVLLQVARNAGVTASAATEAREVIKGLGITTQEASVIVTRFIQNQLSLTDATKLARVAQDAAVIAAQNSSEALAGLLHGILTLQPEVVRTYGLTVNLEQAYAAFAKQTGVTANSLTQAQKQQIALNEVLKSGTAIAGTYEAAMGSVGKQLTSLPRHFEEAANTAGRTLQPALSGIVTVITELLKGFQALPPGIQNLGSALAAAAITVTGLSVAFVALRTAMIALGVGALLNPWVLGTVAALTLVGTAVLALTGKWHLLREAQATAAGSQQAFKITSRLEEIRKEQEELTRLQQPTGRRTTETSAGELKVLEQRNKLNNEAIQLQQALDKLNEPSNRPTPSPAEAGLKQNMDYIAGLKQIPAALQAQIKDIDKQLAIVRGSDQTILSAYLGTEQSAKNFEKIRKTAEANLVKDRQDLVDKLEGIDRKAGAQAVSIAGNVGAERAREELAALESGLASQVQATKIAADQQRVLLDQELSDRLTREPAAYEAIEQELGQRRHAIRSAEAQKLLQIELTEIEQIKNKKIEVLNAEMAGAAGKPVQLASFRRQIVDAEADADTKIAASKAKLAEAEQGLSRQTLDQRLADIRAEQQAVENANQAVLQSRLSLINAEQALIAAQVEGEVITKQEGFEKLRESQAREYELQRTILQQNADAAKRIAEGNDAAILAINQKLTLDLESMAIQQQVTQQQLLNKQTEAWRQFGEDVQRATSDLIFDFLKNGFSNIGKQWDNLLDYMLRLLADFGAMIARPLVMNIIANVVGGVVGAAGSLLGAGGGGGGGGLDLMTLMQIGGIANQTQMLSSISQYFGLDTAMSALSTGFTDLTDSLLTGIDSMFGTTTSAANVAAAEAAQLAGEEFAGMAASGAGEVVPSQLGTALGVAGGAIGMAGGIYGALNASNTASQAAYAASAAASAAYVGGILASAAGATAASTGWTGFGLIAAAVLGVIGLILDQVISPAGPSLAIGDPTGLNIGAEGGQLQVQGDLTTEVHKKEGVDPSTVSNVQAQMEAGITNAVMSIVDVINSVALDPAALLGPTQDALQTALANIQDLNSGSAKHMEQNITEQLKFINVAIIGGLLGPVNMAFEQLLHTDDVTTQIERLPGTTAGLVAIFKTMNDQLAEIAKSQNTDVLRQLSAVKNQVEDFGAKIGGTAAQIAEVIVNDAVENLLAIVPELIDKPLSEQITGFATVMNESQQALVSLQATQGILESAGLQGGGVGDQITRLTEQMVTTAAEVSTAIVSNALASLSTDLEQVTAQAVSVQATTVDSLFTDSLAALNTLWSEWHRLEDLGLDASGVEAQFTALLTGVTNSVQILLSDAFTTEGFADFLTLAASIPAAVTAMNPAWQELQQIALIFNTVVAPINNAILELEASMRSAEEQYAFTTASVDELRGAIVDAGTAVDQLLPLYAELATAIQLQADAYEQVLQDAYQYAFDLIDFAKEQEAIIADLNAQVEALEKQLVSDLEAAIADQTRLIDSLKQQQAAIATSLETIVSEQDRLISNLTSQQEEIIQGYTQLNEQLMSDLVQLKAQVMGLQESIGATLREEAIPTQSADMIRAELAQLQALAATQTGAAQLDTMAQQEALLNELIALGKSTDQLVLIQEAQAGLTTLDAQLQAMHGSIDSQYAAALTEQQAAQALGQHQVALLQAQIDEAQATKVAAQAQLDWIIIQTGNQAQSNAEIIAGAQANYNALQVQINEAVYVRSVLEEQLAWVKAVLGIVETVPLTILSTAAANIGALEHQIAIAKYYLELAQHEIFLMTGTLDYEAAQLSLEAQMEADLAYLNQVELAQLEALNAELALLYATQPAVASLLHLSTAQAHEQTNIQATSLNVAADSRNWLIAIHGRLGALDTIVAQGWHTGGFVHAATGGYASLNHAMTGPLRYAAGGMVPVKLEPGERVLFPSFTSAQQGALVAVNNAFPRFAGGGFTVPGSGTGDTFPALVPEGSFVLNRNASTQLGFQDGGTVEDGSTRGKEPQVTVVLPHDSNDVMRNQLKIQTASLHVLTESLDWFEAIHQQVVALHEPLAQLSLRLKPDTKRTMGQVAGGMVPVKQDGRPVQANNTQASRRMNERPIVNQITVDLQGTPFGSPDDAPGGTQSAEAQINALYDIQMLEEKQVLLQQHMEAALEAVNQSTAAQLEVLEEALAWMSTQPAVANLPPVNPADAETQTHIQDGIYHMTIESRNWLIAIHGQLETLKTLVAQTEALLHKQTGGFVSRATGGYASLNYTMTAPMTYASGGQVPVRLEPGERVFTPPMSHAQQGALVAVNDAFPRLAGGGWTGHGNGSGEAFPALVQNGSFVLNRRPSEIQGYQDGGPVQTSRTQSSGTNERPVEIHNHFDFRGAQFTDQNLRKKVMQIVDEETRRRGSTRL